MNYLTFGETGTPLLLTILFMKKQARNTTKARIDFILTGPQTTGYIESIRIDTQSSLSDHIPISCTIVKNKTENGPGYWRYNNNLLQEP